VCVCVSARVLKYSNVHAHVYLMKETDTASEILCVPITPDGKQLPFLNFHNLRNRVLSFIHMNNFVLLGTVAKNFNLLHWLVVTKPTGRRFTGRLKKVCKQLSCESLHWCMQMCEVQTITAFHVVVSDHRDQHYFTSRGFSFCYRRHSHPFRRQICSLLQNDYLSLCTPWR
jgi:hypothetical protein